ncbi:uncharacterized protein V1518DRAFT_174802 [Limtongia smithiae]|uniref:uncharacterized protein n=1 Tax=Limtongia smithiae TaxID=1125753 RepID=UPI0034CE86EE
MDPQIPGLSNTSTVSAAADDSALHATRLEHDLAVTHAELARLRREHAELTAANEYLTTTNDDLVKQIDELEQDAALRGTNAERWRHRYLAERVATEEVKLQLSRAQDAVRSRDESNRELANAKITLTAQLETAQGRSKELQGEVLSLSRSNAALEERARACEEQVEMLERELDDLVAHAEEQQQQQQGQQALAPASVRRDSDSEPNVRRLSDEYSKEDEDEDEDDDGSGETLWNEESMDEVLTSVPSHNDIRSKFEELKRTSGFETLVPWLTPDELHGITESWREVVADMQIGLTHDKNSPRRRGAASRVSVMDVLVKALVKQQYMIRQVLGGAGLREPGAERIISDVTADENKEGAKQSARTPREPTAPPAEIAEHPMSDSDVTAQSVSEGAHAAADNDDTDVTDITALAVPAEEMSQLYTIAVVLLVAAVAIGMGVCYVGWQARTARAQCAHGGRGTGAMVRRERGVPWWVGSSVPGVEKTLFRLEGWMRARYGSRRIIS